MTQGFSRISDLCKYCLSPDYVRSHYEELLVIPFVLYPFKKFMLYNKKRAINVW